MVSRILGKKRIQLRYNRANPDFFKAGTASFKSFSSNPILEMMLMVCHVLGTHIGLDESFGVKR